MFDIRKPALTIGADGLMLRTCALAKRDGDMLQANAAALAMLARPEQVAVVEKAIKAWNRGEQTRALIYLAHLGEPELKTEAQVRAELAKAGFDPSQPRDGNNQKWVAEGDGNTTGAAGNGGGTTATAPASNVAPGVGSIADAQAIVDNANGQYLGPNGNCASLTHSLVPDLPAASQWQRGDPVQGSTDLPIGTPIATFNYHGQAGTNGYGSPTSPGGLSGMSHTGIYLGQDAAGITILNQWSTHLPTISQIPWSAWSGNSNEGGSRYYSIR